MRLNFWQWIGLILLIVGLIWLVWRETAAKRAPAPVPAPTADSRAPLRSVAA